MARLTAWVPDLLFGSRVQAALAAAGHDVELVAQLDVNADVDAVIVDLTADAPERIGQARGVLARGVPGLAFYAHVDTDTRAQADQAGFALVVPRSRMAREAPALIARLLG